jgi:UDP-glucose 4-epimerase
LAHALRQLFNANSEVRIIGTRHGEKLYETLLNREEMAKAEDLGDYYRIPADCRDLNYSCYFSEGEPRFSVQEEYNSYNTRRLGVDEMIEFLKTLDIVQEALRTGRMVL